MTFAEHIAGLTTPYSCFTPVLRGVLTQIALAVAGRAGARLAERTGIGVGGDTLLRLVRALPEPDAGAVEVLGVDDFAFRKGRHYGEDPLGRAQARRSSKKGPWTPACGPRCWHSWNLTSVAIRRRRCAGR